jgi:hypothetical protein
MAVQSLTSVPAEVRADSRTAALDIMRSALVLSTPNLTAADAASGSSSPPSMALTAFPREVGDSILSVIANVLSAANIGTQQQSAGAGGGNASAVALVTAAPDVRAGANGTALLNRATSTMALLTAAALRAVPFGSLGVMNFSSVPPSALSSGGGSGGSNGGGGGGGGGEGGNSSFCGLGITMLSARVPPGDSNAAALAFAAPLHPCLSRPAALDVLSRAPVPPPPSIQLPAALFSAISRSVGSSSGGSSTSGDGGSGSNARGVDVQVIQWAESPFNETAGLDKLRYATPTPRTSPSASAAGSRARGAAAGGRRAAAVDGAAAPAPAPAPALTTAERFFTTL